MPSLIKHSDLSTARTGKPFMELHEWIEEDHKDTNIPKRHDIIRIPENMEIVKEKFGEGASEEFLYHIKEDYEENVAYKMVLSLLRIKRAVLPKKK